MSIQRKKVARVRFLPNILSISRIIAALFLLIPNNLPLFTVCYLFCGATDVLDGMIARSFGHQSRLGAKLDSLGDFIFWLIVLPLLYVRTEIFTVPVLICIGIVFLIRLVNLIITRTKFKHPAQSCQTPLCRWFRLYKTETAKATQDTAVKHVSLMFIWGINLDQESLSNVRTKLR